MNFAYSGLTDVGLKRAVNQDSILMSHSPDENVYIFAVADGMGGHADGELASRAVISGLSEWLCGFNEEYYGNDFNNILNDIMSRLEDVNQFVYENYNVNQVCGSTCMIMVIYRDAYGLISLGDSHIYYDDGMNFSALTMDDVWENLEKVKNKYNEMEILQNPNYGKLTKAFGTDEGVDFSVNIGQLKQGDAFLLCSDGLYKYVNEYEISGCMRSLDGNDDLSKIRNLKMRVYENGAKDNISIISVKCLGL